MPNAVEAMRFEREGDAWYRVTATDREYVGPLSDDQLSDAEADQARRRFTPALERLQLPDGELPRSFPPQERLSNPGLKQGERKTCVSFALVAAMERRLPQLNGARLSRQYAHWTLMREDHPSCADYGTWTPRLIEGAKHLTAWPICPDADSPYTDRGMCWRDDETSAQARAGGKAVYRIKDWLLLCGMSYCPRDETPIDVDLLRRLIVKGYDIAVSIPQILTAGCNGRCIHPVPLNPGGTRVVPDCNFTGHCLLIVGYGASRDGDYFQCFDSANGLLIRVSVELIRWYVRYGIVVTECEQLT